MGKEIEDNNCKIGIIINDRCNNIEKIMDENENNIPRMKLLISLELMRIQNECEKLGVAYF